MQDSKKVTISLLKLYARPDLVERLNFKIFLRLTGVYALPRESAVLDCGCATGNVMYLLQQSGFKNICGVDASAEMIKEAERLFSSGPMSRYRVNTRFLCGDALRLSSILEPTSFDAIIAMNIQHHVGYEKEWEIFINECRTIIKPDGLLFIREPYPTFLLNVLRWMTRYAFFFKIKLLRGRLQSLIEEDPQLGYFLDRWPGCYKRLLERNGFAITKQFSLIGHRIVVAKSESKKLH
jgi:SAM-dependent methyltransferase